MTSAVHGPIPCKHGQRVVRLIGRRLGKRRKIEAALGNLRAMTLSVLIFAADRPKRHNRSVRAARMIVIQIVIAAAMRAQIAAAANVETCWPQMVAARPKLGPPSQRRLPGHGENRLEPRILRQQHAQRGVEVILGAEVEGHGAKCEVRHARA